MTSRIRPNSRVISDMARSCLWQNHAEGVLRALARPAIHLAREASVWPDALKSARGRGPLAVFLPAYGREGAALLRIHAIAEALPRFGWRSLVLPSTLTLAQRHRLIAASRPDVLVMQGARHALNRPALYPGCPVVYDMDDADFHLPHLQEPVARAMPQVAAVIAGSEYIADWCRAAGAGGVITVLTGMPVSARRHRPQAERPPVVAWAQTRPMQYTAEAGMVREVMRRVARGCPEVRFRLYDRRPGDDDAVPAGFEAAGIRTEWRAATGLRDYLASFDDVAIGLAPLCPETPFSRGKSVGKVLAYLDRKVPVVASDAGEHRRVFDAASGVVSNDPGVWSTEILRLLRDAPARQRMADAGFAVFRDRFSTGAVAEQVAGVLAAQVARPEKAAS